MLYHRPLTHLSLNNRQSVGGIFQWLYDYSQMKMFVFWFIFHWNHGALIKWKYFLRYWPCVRGIHRWLVVTHKGQWRGDLMFYFMCALIKGWAKNRDADDLRRHRAHYDVAVMLSLLPIGHKSVLIHVIVWCWRGDKPLQRRHNGRDGVSNHRRLGCLLNRLCRPRSKKKSKLRGSSLCAGNSPVTDESPHKGPVTRKMYPFDKLIMPFTEATMILFIDVYMCHHGAMSLFYSRLTHTSLQKLRNW